MRIFSAPRAHVGLITLATLFNCFSYFIQIDKLPQLDDCHFLQNECDTLLKKEQGITLLLNYFFAFFLPTKDNQEPCID